jgi:hypothetical protein
VLLALAVDVLDECVLVFGADGVGRLELGEQLILATLQPGSMAPRGAPRSVFSPPDCSTRTSTPTWRGRWKLAMVFHTP